MRGSGIPSFDAQTRAFRLARDILAGGLRSGRTADGVEADILSEEVLPAVQRIARGVGLTTRAQRLDTATTRDLLAREGLFGSPRPAAERGAAGRASGVRDTARELDLTAGNALAAANHAQLVLAFIPRLPSDLVTWPRLRLAQGYADVLAPHGVGEVIERVGEIEWTLERAASGEHLAPDERLRRTYAFCETACWLDLSLSGR